MKNQKYKVKFKNRKEYYKNILNETFQVIVEESHSYNNFVECIESYVDKVINVIEIVPKNANMPQESKDVWKLNLENDLINFYQLRISDSIQ